MANATAANSTIVLPSWVKTEALAWQYGVYGYEVSRSRAWVACAAFGIIGLINLSITLAKSPRARYMYWIPLTAACEAVGYVLRVTSLDSMKLPELIATMVLLLIPPIFLAIVDYYVLGYLLDKGGLKVCCLKPGVVRWIFFAGDIACFIVQVMAAPLLTSGKTDMQKIGQKVVLVGLLLQFLIFFLFFVTVIWTSCRPPYATSRAAVAPQNSQSIPAAFLAAHGHEFIPFQRSIILTVLATIFLLLFRNGYRVYEYVTDMARFERNQPRGNKEWEFYVFETVPVWICYVLLTASHFGVRITNATASKYGDKNEKGDLGSNSGYGDGRGNGHASDYGDDRRHGRDRGHGSDRSYGHDRSYGNERGYGQPSEYGNERNHGGPSGQGRGRNSRY